MSGVEARLAATGFFPVVAAYETTGVIARHSTVVFLGQVEGVGDISTEQKLVRLPSDFVLRIHSTGAIDVAIEPIELRQQIAAVLKTIARQTQRHVRSEEH